MLMQVEIKNRWTGKIQFTAEVECEDDASIGVKIGLAVKWAHSSCADLSDADLSCAVLRCADLSDADLSCAVLRCADLRGAVLRGAVLRGAVPTVPTIPNIHAAVYAAAAPEGALDMGHWHSTCGTSHCRAGWVVTLAGEPGKALETRIGTPAAAALIYLASDPKLERIPDFYCSNAAALADMKRLAETAP